jgi:hypothetical protein
MQQKEALELKYKFFSHFVATSLMLRYAEHFVVGVLTGASSGGSEQS